MVLEGFSLSSMDPGGGFGGAFGGGKAGGAQDPMSFVKRPAVIARICALVSDSHCRKSLRPSTQSQFRLRRTFIFKALIMESFENRNWHPIYFL